MLTIIEGLMRKLPAPPAGRTPGVACVIGFLFGGIGLAIYLKNIVDLVFPVTIAIVMAVAVGDVGVLGGALFAALYGYFRVGVFVNSSDGNVESAATHA
jgi:hypothetical protein